MSALDWAAYDCLFLDRDGVLNERPMGGYVTRPDALRLCAGAGEALARLRPRFRRMVVVTNQQGIGKGLMGLADLAAVHGRLREQLALAGAYVDAIYCCPHLRSAGCACRKPALGMARQARAEFPDLDWSRSVMVGDTAGDLQFGQAAGMATIWVASSPDAAERAAAEAQGYTARVAALAGLPALLGL